MTTKKRIISIIIKLALIIGVLVGVYATGGASSQGGDNFMAGRKYLFFTIQSNLTIGAVCLVFVAYEIINLIRAVKNLAPLVIPNWVRTVKFVFTVAISLTFLVFSVILTPSMIALGQSAYFLSLSNIFCHNVVPILAIVDWLIFDTPHQNKKLTLLWGTAMPLYYVALAFICDACNVVFTGGENPVTVPYFFFDYHTYGWFDMGKGGGMGVIYWILLQVLMVIGISVVLMWGKNKIKAKSGATQNEA